MRRVLAIAALVLAFSVGAASAASAEDSTISVSRGPWTCTVVFVDNNGNGYPDFGDVIVSASCTRTLPRP
jgi:formylmethanofuran dehydrogenase subunit D